MSKSQLTNKVKVKTDLLFASLGFPSEDPEKSACSPLSTLRACFGSYSSVLSLVTVLSHFLSFLISNFSGVISHLLPNM